MTECKPKKLVLSGLGRHRVEADFEGGRLTSDAGLLLLREVDRRLQLIHAVDQAIPDPRDPRYTIHEQQELLAQRILAIATLFPNEASLLRLITAVLMEQSEEWQTGKRYVTF